MTVDGASEFDTAYAQTCRAPHGAQIPPIPPALIAAQERLAFSRQPGETLVATYRPDDPDGFGPALQIVTDQATTLMDSVTVLLHRLSVAYSWLAHPAVQVRRDADGVLLDARPHQSGAAPDGIVESWIHLQLSRSVDPHAVAEAARLLPMVVADARRVAQDSPALVGTLQNLADDRWTDSSRFAGPGSGRSRRAAG